MIINLQQLTVFLPFIILMLTTVISILLISYKRNHFFVYLLSILGFITAFFSLYFLIKIVPTDKNLLFYIDKPSILYIGMIIFSGISTCFFAYSWLEKHSFNKEEFYLLILLSTLGSMTLVISNHMAALLISIELMSLPVFGLLAYSRYQKYFLESTFKYIILSGLSLSFLILGIAWVYAISGSLFFASIHNIFYHISFDKQLVMLFGIGMILFALFFKISIIPFHLWTPDIYQGAPSLVLSFFSTAGKISICIILFRFFSCISLQNNESIYFLISCVTFLSMLFGNVMALFQNNIKRLFGYSSISQLGCLLIILLVSKNNYLFSLEAVGVYLLGYLFSNIAYFGVIILTSELYKKNEIASISSYQGLFWSQPILSSILTLVLLSLAGIPMTLGFIGKFYILSIIVKERLWVIGSSFLISTILGIYCYFRVIINLYLQPKKQLSQHLNTSNYCVYNVSSFFVFFSGILLLVFGIYPNPIISLVKFF